MATPVLPYPDMDFTPLDILTAEEMDEIVANVEYLKTFCGGLADGSNLSDGVIQARKIDYNVLTIKGSGSAYQIGSNTKISLSSIYGQNGNKLSLSDGGIKIGQGISKVKITANVFYEKVSGAYGWAKIKNSGSWQSPTAIADLSGNYGSAVFSELVKAVSPNEVIYLWNIDGNLRIRPSDTWMTISVIN